MGEHAAKQFVMPTNAPYIFLPLSEKNTGNIPRELQLEIAS